MANEKKGLVDITTGVEVSDANANGILDLTSGEVTQVANIGATTISAGQWVYLGAADQGISTSDSVAFAGLDVASSTFQLATGTTVNEIVTSVSGSSTDDQLPTAAAVWAAVQTADGWDEVMHIDNTFTVLDTENLSVSITQNDTTNNPAAMVIANTGTGNDITLPNSSYIKNGDLVLGGDAGLTGSRITKGWFTDLEITNFPSINGTALTDQYLATTDDVQFKEIKSQFNATSYFNIVPYTDRIEIDYGSNVTDVYFNRATQSTNHQFWGSDATDPLLYIEGGTNKIGFRTNTPSGSHDVTVEGTMLVKGGGLECDTSLNVSSGTFQLPTGGTVNEIVSTISSPTNNQLATAAAIETHILTGTEVSAPSSYTDTGTQGQWAYSSDYMYKCIGTDTWVRWVVVTRWP